MFQKKQTIINASRLENEYFTISFMWCLCASIEKKKKCIEYNASVNKMIGAVEPFSRKLCLDKLDDSLLSEITEMVKFSFIVVYILISSILGQIQEEKWDTGKLIIH